MPAPESFNPLDGLEPVRTHFDGNDWTACFANYVVGDPLGTGDTEQAAVDDLLDNLEPPMSDTTTLVPTTTAPAPAPGALVVAANQLRLNVPAARYHKEPGLSISRLKRMAVSPQHFQFVPPESDQSVPQHLGSAAHCAVLEPQRFARDYVVWNRTSEAGNLCPRKGQHWDKFLAEHTAAGHEIVMPDEYEHALAIQRAVRGDKWAMRYLASGAAEVTMRWTMHGRLCRGREDWLTEVDGRPHLIGLKTAEDVRLYKFSNAAFRYGYHLQWAWYHDGYQTIRAVRPAMKEIVVESKAPHAVVVYDIPEEVIDIGREEYERLLELLADCERANDWPGPGMGGECAFSLPSWAYRQDDAENDLTDIGLVFEA